MKPARRRLIRRAMSLLAAATLTFAVSGVAAPSEAAADTSPAGCPGQSSHTTNAGTFVRSHHPLVLVHGWSSKSDSMYQVELGLKKRIPNTFDFRYFDYRDHATDWAARPVIAACLADYINEVSKNYRAAGGDGKVFLAAHSMGGLAIRFATDPNTVEHPVTGAEIGGVVTIDTPHLGSVFGNTWQSSLIQWAKEHLSMDPAPGRTSDAAKCLALHDNKSRNLPSGCPTPPYLPANTNLAEISGTNTVLRTLFGVQMYDIPLNSDGIVSVDSSHGYLTSGPTGQRPPRTVGTLPSAECTSTSDETLSLLTAAAKTKSLPAGIIAAELKALSILKSDSAALDAVNEGTLTPDLEVMLGVTYAFTKCGHSAMLHNDDALDAAASSLRGWLASISPVTLNQLSSAPVPSLCGHKAGKLVNGKLPGIPATKGIVQLATVSGKKANDVDAFGDLDGDGTGDAAVTFDCNQGGVGWPNQMVFYGPGPTVLGSFDMGKVVGDARGGTTHVTYTHGTVKVNTIDARAYDTGCCASGRAIVTLRWNGSRIIAANVDHLTGPTDITFDGIGPVKLGMTDSQLKSLGYTAEEPDAFGCVSYSATDKPYVTFNPVTGKTVAVNAGGDDTYQTAIGGLKPGQALLAFVEAAFKGYTAHKYFNRDFGQGAYGYVVDGPGGSISFSIADAPTPDGLEDITTIGVGAPGFTTAEEVSCT